MGQEDIRQLLIDMGSELDIENDIYEKYEPLRQRGLVEFVNGKMYKTMKGRQAILNPHLIKI